MIMMSSDLDEPYVLLRSTSDQPIKLQANDVPGLYDSVFEFRESLFVQLREAYEAGDQSALSELWKSARAPASVRPPS
jgi:hypothetical protein